MIVLYNCALAIIIIHVAWLIFFLLGATTRASFNLTANQSEHVSEFVLASATGMALCGFYGLIAGLAGIFYYWALPAFFAVHLLVVRALGVNVFSSKFWNERLAVVAGSLSPLTLIVYLAGMLFAIPAAAPDVAFDSNQFHLVYAFEWAHNHRLTVDPTLRSPYYAMNWQILYAWYFLFGVGSFTSTLSALAVTLSAIAIQAAILSWVQHDPKGRSFEGSLLAILAPSLAIFVSPVFLRWGTSSMVDAPHGLMFFVTAFAVARTVAYDRCSGSGLLRCVILGGFLAGLKPTFLAFLPIIAAYMIRLDRNRRKTAVLAVVSLLILSAPWYVRSFVGSGDPITPELNLAVHGVDPKFSKRDWELISRDIGPGHETIRSFAFLPLRLAFRTGTDEFREYGSSIAMLAIYLPLAMLTATLLWRKYRLTTSPYLTCLAVFSSLGVSYWLITSHLARYTMLFAPCLLAFLAIWLMESTGFIQAVWFRRILQIGVTLALFISALPTPSQSSLRYLRDFGVAYYRYLPTLYTSPENFIESGHAGYTQEEYISSFEQGAGRRKRVLALCCKDLTFLFRKNGVTLVGDVIGPERYDDFDIAAHTHRLKQYLNRFDVDAILIAKHKQYSDWLIEQIVADVRTFGYSVAPVSNRDFVVLVETGSRR